MKKSAVKFLSKYGITRDDSEFKEVFGFVYRGASFALVSQCVPFIFCWDPGACFMSAHWILIPVFFYHLTENMHGIRGDKHEPNRQMCRYARADVRPRGWERRQITHKGRTCIRMFHILPTGQSVIWETALYFTCVDRNEFHSLHSVKIDIDTQKKKRETITN